MPKRWATMAPIEHSGYLPSNAVFPIRFSKGVQLSEIPKWGRSADFLKSLGDPWRKSLPSARYCLIVYYEADAHNSPDPKWKHDPPRSIQDAALECIMHMDFSLWLARAMGLSFSYVIDSDAVNGRWYKRRVVWVRSAVPVPDDGGVRLDAADFANATALFRSMRKLGIKDTVRTATDVARRGVTELGGWPLRFLILWLAVESLFGPDDGREMTFRLSQRVALFLGGRNVLETFEKVKRSYGWRSKVVHGLKLQKLTPEKSRELMIDLEKIVRECLVKILRRKALVERFNGKDRENFLEDLWIRVGRR